MTRRAYVLFAAAGLALFLARRAAAGSIRGEAEQMRRASGYPESWRGR